MDYAAHFHREILAFEAAARRAADADEAPMVPSCPGWSVSDLVLHLGSVHRYVTLLLEELPAERPDPTDIFYLRLPADTECWPRPENAPNRGPLAKGLLDWFAAGAAALESCFRSIDPQEPVWAWSREQSVAFWLRMQTIEAAVHLWDAECALEAARPVHQDLAVDGVEHFTELMMPVSRSRKPAAPGSGERYRFRATDVTGTWSVRFDGDEVRRTEDSESYDVELAGTASELMLFLWGRIPADRLRVNGDLAILARYGALVPPV
ncbi:maleylpyruvate isomerase family mycothiol-dependent enzyme [Streptomyces sp. NPDC005408]|uniref:maleylpyruvate isomerase family mycothiol-dependent enzyme n=1 Tax=Streptomyces sp. NPDC005408 TaxID=3155341 RepID=UPI0033ACC2B2